MAKYEDKKQLKCSFCGKNQDQVKRLIAGPVLVYGTGTSVIIGIIYYLLLRFGIVG